MNNTNNGSRYRWYILVLLALTGCFVIAMPQMCMPVLFKEIADELGLSFVQIGTVWGMLPLAGLLVMLLGGMIADRFGAKKILVIGSLLTGLTGMARALSGDFPTLTATMFLFGILQVLTAPSMFRACGTWFSGKHLGLANGIMSMSMGVGFLVSSMISSSVLSPLLGGWRSVLVAYGVMTVIVGLLWVFTRKEPEHQPAGSEVPAAISFKESLLKVVRIRNVWVLTIIIMLQVSCTMGTLGYLPTYLKNIGWEPAAADNTVALFHGMSALFTIPVVLLSNRLKSRKIVLFIATLMTAAGVGILAFTTGNGVWAGMIIAGMVRDGFMATHMTTLLETKGLKIAYIGAVVGFSQSLGRIGEIISPPIGGKLAEINPQYPFLLWSGMAVLALFAFLFFKKEQAKKKPDSATS